MTDRNPLPTGTVTLLFTDIEGFGAWGAEVAAHLDPARAAIGDAAADAAYEEGHSLPRDRAIEAFFAIQVEAAVA